MKAFLRDWQEHRACQWLLRRGVSPRVVQAGGISLGAHGLLFLLIAFFPGLSFAPAVPAPEEEGVLEIAFQTTAPEANPESPARPEEQPVPQTDDPATPAAAANETVAAAPAEPPPAPGAEAERGIITQLDPEYLKKTAEAPKDATFIASHNAEATSGGAPDRSRPDAPAGEGAVEFRTAQLAQAPQPAEAEGASIAALGAWNKAVGNAIGARWDHYRRTKVESLRPGSVRLRFSIDAKGRVGNVHILSNDAGSTNALYAVRSTTEAEIPPIPADRLARLPGKGKRIEVKYTFTIWPNS